MKKTIIILSCIASCFIGKTQIVTDNDGNTYNIVKIGSQVWMKENLRVTKYLNGDSIKTTWPATKLIAEEVEPKYQWSYNGIEDSVLVYGRLYTWFAATDIRGVCPTGWHVPSDSDWTVLTNYLGGENVASNKLKESGTTHWSDPNNASNISGFTALPSGLRYTSGKFYGIGESCNFWSSTSQTNGDYVWGRGLEPNIVHRTTLAMKVGYAVRCLSDSTMQVNMVNEINAKEKIIIYPNPAKDFLYIKNNKFSNNSVTIFDMHGKQVASKNIINNFIDISNLDKGIYFVKILDSYNTFVQILIKD